MSCNFRLLPWRRVVASHGLPARAAVMASRAVMPWAAAESRYLRLRHQRARVAWMCRYPEMAWCRLAALAPCSETLFVQSTAGRW